MRPNIVAVEVTIGTKATFSFAYPAPPPALTFITSSRGKVRVTQLTFGPLAAALLAPLPHLHTLFVLVNFLARLEPCWVFLPPVCARARARDLRVLRSD